MKGLLDKSKFYAAIPPIEKVGAGVNFFLRFGGDKCYELVFNWQVRDPIMFVQLIDLRIQGPKKHIVPTLQIDVTKEKVDTRYRLYKRLNQWVTEAIREKEGV